MNPLVRNVLGPAGYPVFKSQGKLVVSQTSVPIPVRAPIVQIPVAPVATKPGDI